MTSNFPVFTTVQTNGANELTLPKATSPTTTSDGVPSITTSERKTGETAAYAELQTKQRTVNSDGPLGEAKITTYKVGNRSISFANNLGGTPIAVTLGGQSILFSCLNDGGFTGALNGAGSIGGGPEVWPAGRIYDSNFQPIITTEDGTTIDLSEDKKYGLIPSDTSDERLLMHGRGFSTPKWNFSEPRLVDGELTITKTLKFNDDNTCRKFGPGKLEITYTLGTNPETGKDRLRTSIKASSENPEQNAYLGSLALHYFMKAEAEDIFKSEAILRHNSDPKHPSRPRAGFVEVKNTDYDFSQGVDIIGAQKTPEGIICGFKERTQDGLYKLGTLQRKKYSLEINAKAQLGGRPFATGLLVFRDPKTNNRICLEPYFGDINAYNRQTEADVKPLTVGKQGDFEAVVDLELTPTIAV